MEYTAFQQFQLQLIQCAPVESLRIADYRSVKRTFAIRFRYLLMNPCYAYGLPESQKASGKL